MKQMSLADHPITRRHFLSGCALSLAGVLPGEPQRLTARVKELGFTQVWDFGPKKANARYFAGRADGLCASPMHHLMKGQVGSVS